jgi:hypothetical protein
MSFCTTKINYGKGISRWYKSKWNLSFGWVILLDKLPSFWYKSHLNRLIFLFTKYVNDNYKTYIYSKQGLYLF